MRSPAAAVVIDSYITLVITNCHRVLITVDDKLCSIQAPQREAPHRGERGERERERGRERERIG